MKNPFQIKQHFSQIFRPPTSPSYHPAIAGIRSIAFLWVVIMHCLSFGSISLTSFVEYDDYVNYNPVGSFVNAGSYGVDLFLLLSGFLLFETLYNHTVQSGTFNVVTLLISRMWRLLPVLLFVSLFLRVAGNTECPQMSELLFYYNYEHLYNSFVAQECLVVSWSVSLDFQCWIIVAVIYWIITKARATSSERWKIKVWDIIALIAITSKYNIWSAFSINPRIPPSTHLGDYIHTELAENMQKHLNVTLPWNIYDPKNNQNVLDNLPLAYIYFTTPSRIVTFLYGLLAGQLYYLEDKFISHLHQRSVLYLPIALLFVILPVPFSMLPCNIHLSSLSYGLRNLSIALHRQVFIAGVTFFFLLALSSRIPSKVHSPSFIGKAIRSVLSCYFWYPISQLSFIAYLFSALFIMLVAMKFYPPTPSTISSLYLVKATVLSVTPLLMLSIPIYVFVEMPAMEVKKWFFPSRLGPNYNSTQKKSK